MKTAYHEHTNTAHNTCLLGQGQVIGQLYGTRCHVLLLADTRPRRPRRTAEDLRHLYHKFSGHKGRVSFNQKLGSLSRARSKREMYGQSCSESPPMSLVSGARTGT